jgi:beta-phosphoglucomutase-like phosphatase (HAD superfamily)
MRAINAPTSFSAVLFGLSGCLVDFGARTLPIALSRTLGCSGAVSCDQPAEAALSSALGRKATPDELAALQDALLQSAKAHAQTTAGALQQLKELHQQGVPCAWLDELPPAVGRCLATPLPEWLIGIPLHESRPWPAPDACWQALIALQVSSLDGCVVVSGSPRLLQAGLRAGLWTVGLAACSGLCGLAPEDWQTLGHLERDRLRAQATLQLYRLGVHSVIDHLGELGPCLQDLATRRQKGEKP